MLSKDTKKADDCKTESHPVRKIFPAAAPPPPEGGREVGAALLHFQRDAPRLSPGTHGAAAGRASESFPAVFSWRAGGCGSAGNVFRGRAVSGRKIRAPPKGDKNRRKKTGASRPARINCGKIFAGRSSQGFAKGFSAALYDAINEAYSTIGKNNKYFL